MKKEVVISEGISIRQFADLLGQQPPAVIADLKRLGIFAKENYIVDFETMRNVAQDHGYTAKRSS